MPDETPELNDLPEDVQAYITELEDALAEAPTADSFLDELKSRPHEELAELLGLELVAKSAPTPAPEDLPEPIRKRLEEAETRATELAEVVRKMDEDRTREIYIAKAAGFSAIGGAAELGPVLMALAKADPEAYKSLETYLVSANAAAAEAHEILTKERGTGAGGNPTVAGELENLVKAKQLATPTMTKEQAQAEVLNERPDLFSRFHADRG